MRLSLGGAKWTIVLLTPEQFMALHGEEHRESAAITDTVSKVISFQTGQIDMVIIRHELFHAYCDSTLIVDSDLDMNQMEELCCNIIGRYGEELVKNSRKILRYLLKQQLTLDTIV